MSDTLVLLGRILIAVIFIFSGYGKVTDIVGTSGYFGSVGLPVPVATAWAVGLLELLGGLAILIGFQTCVAALLLAAFTLAAGFVAHFDFADPMQITQFLKNLAMTGGLVVLAVYGPGTLSLDGRRR